jgi:hypothetical protein
MSAREPKRCPRCAGWIPTNENPGAHPGALSRVDNKTEICSNCGTEEAILDARALQVMRKPDPLAKCCFCDDVAFVWHLGLNLCLDCDEKRYGDDSVMRILLDFMQEENDDVEAITRLNRKRGVCLDCAEARALDSEYCGTDFCTYDMREGL